MSDAKTRAITSRSTNGRPAWSAWCSLNNFDPTTYDVPGQFGYVRLSYKM